MPQRARSRQSHLKDCRKPSKPQFVGECRRVKLNEICSRGKSSLRQKDVINDGPYSVYGASGVVGTTSDYQNEIPYVAVIKDGAGVGRASACEPITSVLGTMQALIPQSKCRTRLPTVSCEVAATRRWVFRFDHPTHLLQGLRQNRGSASFLGGSEEDCLPAWVD